MDPARKELESGNRLGGVEEKLINPLMIRRDCSSAAFCTFSATDLFKGFRLNTGQRYCMNCSAFKSASAQLVLTMLLCPVMAILRNGDWITTIDFKDAFLPIHENNRKLLRFQWTTGAVLLGHCQLPAHKLAWT